MKQTKGRQLLVVVSQGERKHRLSADSKGLCMAGDQAQELIVILGRWGYVYAIINLGTCLFARD